MSKPTKTEAELVAMARAELKVHADGPDGIGIFVVTTDDGWEFRTEADEETRARPGYGESVAMIVQIGDHLSKQYDVAGGGAGPRSAKRRPRGGAPNTANRRAEDPHVIAAGNLAGLFGGETAAQHRCHQLHPLRIILHRARIGLLIGADANVIDPDDVDHFLQAIDIFFKAAEEVPDADGAASFGDRAGVVRADLPRDQRRCAHRAGSGQRGVRQ